MTMRGLPATAELLVRCALGFSLRTDGLIGVVVVDILTL